MMTKPRRNSVIRPLPKYINEKRAEQMIRPEKDLDGICAVNTAKVFAGEKVRFCSVYG